MKPILTKKAIIAIKEKRKFRMESPVIQEVAGRVAASAWFIDDANNLKLWTTGEANPSAKAVEGSHPTAMAEKRLKARGYLALECGEGSGVYAEEEFNQDYIDAARKGGNTAPPPKGPRGTDSGRVHQEKSNAVELDKPNQFVRDRKEWWDSAIGAIAESTGLEPAQFARYTWDHCVMHPFDGKITLPTDYEPLIKDMVKLASWKPEWANEAYQNISTIRDTLKEGREFILNEPNQERTDVIGVMTLRPTASGDSASPQGNEGGAKE